MSKKIEKREYQTIAVNAVVEALQTSSRTQLHMAPGTGKTIVSLQVKETLDSTLTVFFAPTIQLLHQQFFAWESFKTKPYRSLAIVSGSPVRAKQDNSKNLKIQHVETTTDPTSIAKFINSRGRRTIFCTYKSVPTLIDAMVSTNRFIDLAIFDEAHRVAGSYEKTATKILNHESIKIRKWLFMTATPKILVNRKDSIYLAGMDDASLFGKVAYTLTFREALDSNILVDYQVVASIVTEADLEDIGITKSRTENIALAAISKAIQLCELKNGITFHSTIAGAVGFSTLLREYIAPETYVNTLNATHTSKHRSEVISQVKLCKQSILTNVRILGEGYDFSALDYVVFVDPKHSPVDIVQNIGRVMRKHKDKDMGTIIIPIMIEKSINEDDFRIDSSRFSSIFHVASAIGSIDTMFAALLSHTSNGSFRADKKIQQFINDRIKVIGIDSVNKKVIKTLEEKIKQYIIVGSRREFKRDEMLKKLKRFCEKHNRLPSRTKPEELSLSTFVYLVHNKNVPPETKGLIQPFIDKYRTQKINKNLSVEEQFDIFEAWVRQHKRFPYSGSVGSKQHKKDLLEANGMTLTDEEYNMQIWLHARFPKKQTPKLKKRMSDLRKWVKEVCPSTSQIKKMFNIRCGAHLLKKRLDDLGVEPHFCYPFSGGKVLWDIEKVRTALNLH